TLTVQNVGSWDPELGVFTGSCGTFTCVGQRDSAGTGGNETYTVTGSVTGTTYYVNIGHYSGTTDNPEGTFTLAATSSVLGTANFNEAAFSAFPNPVKDILNLSYNESIGQVSVCNLLGQQLLAKSVNANQAQIDFSTLSQGAYLVKVVSGNTSKTIKVVKQ
ncbi:MAG: T9SS type A sorting domain-containing protein, partial [Flavobacterium sp.]